MELAHKVRKMLSDSTFPTPGGENGGEKYKISDIGRDGARRLLERSNCGTFLIRDGRTAECALVLSVKLQHRVCHYRIIKDSNSRYRDGSSRFDSLDELIDARKQTSSMHNDFKLGACVTYNL
ncbi:hypothetical protein GBAR_LOCUS22781 [Geodia barretti]|uniref:SH2 domain-containing protein n=1 Tax=Geodia barretti TaxID=519541 RepID=A0AA35T575_GEOBA|nr:hypothetical protein GBAR_LOCUS22781 [Geodia barretti]